MTVCNERGAPHARSQSAGVAQPLRQREATMKPSSRSAAFASSAATVLFLIAATTDTVFAVDKAPGASCDTGKCVMRGVCDPDGSRAPCVYDGEPKSIESAKSREVLESVCGDVLGNVSQPLCCDGSQVEDFAENLESAKAIGLDNCPACSVNFRTLMCQMICSPRQAEFIQLLTSDLTEQKERYVASMNYYVAPQFVQGLFDSCKDSRSKIPSIGLFNFICGRWGSDCTPERWLGFLGSSAAEGGLSPISVKHIQTSEEHRTSEGAVFKPLSPEPYVCHQDRGAVKSCACDHCKASCT